MIRGVLAACLLSALPVAPVVADEILRTATITYVAGKAIYVDAGQDAGLDVGDLVRVVRGGEAVAELKVVAASAKRSLCEVTTDFEALAGDVIEFEGVAPGTSDPALSEEPVVEEARAAKRPSRNSSRGWLRSNGIRGRVGVRYLSLENTGVDTSIRQPAVDMRVEGQNLFGSELDVSVDARARRSVRTSGEDSEAEGRTRVYRLHGAWDAEPFRVVGGRQPSVALSAVGIFDGLLAQMERDTWSFGAFIGTQPDADDFGYSTDIREHGAWLTRRGGALPSTWQITGGYVGSYRGSTINRENFVLQGRLFRPRATLFVLQEADLHRGWKAKAEGGTIALTSSYASGRYRAFERLWVDAGFDTRRNVRLYRDRITPETEFDDSYRQGYWGGMRYEFDPTTRASISYRRTTGGASDANSATATLYASRPRWSDSSFSLRTTLFENRISRGRLHSVSAGVRILRTHAVVTGGVRAESDRSGTAEDSDARWITIELDRQIARPWFALLSWDRGTGSDPEDETTQLHVSLLYRF